MKSVWIVEYKFDGDEDWSPNPSFCYTSETVARSITAQRAKKYLTTEYRATEYRRFERRKKCP